MSFSKSHSEKSQDEDKDTIERRTEIGREDESQYQELRYIATIQCLSIELCRGGYRRNKLKAFLTQKGPK